MEQASKVFLFMQNAISMLFGYSLQFYFNFFFGIIIIIEETKF